MKLIFLLLLLLVGQCKGGGWYYYNYDLFCSRIYPYTSEERIEELYFKQDFQIDGSVKYGGIGEVLREVEGLEVVAKAFNKLRLFSQRGELLFEKEYVNLGSLVLDDITKDGEKEVIVGGGQRDITLQRDEILYVIEVLDFSISGSISTTSTNYNITSTTSYNITSTTTKRFIIGTFTDTTPIRPQPRTITDIDYDGKLDVIATVGVGRNYKPGYLYVFDYDTGACIFKAEVSRASFSSQPTGEYPVILLSGGSPYSPKDLSSVDTDGYIIGFDLKGEVCWRYKTNTWLIRSIITNLDNQGQDELVVIQGPPESKIYVLNPYTGILYTEKDDTKDSITSLVYNEEGVFFTSGAVADLNKDNEKEIVIGCSDNKLLLLNKDLSLIGTVGFNYIPYIRVINDINGDGLDEVIISAGNEVLVLDNTLSVIGSFTLSSSNNNNDEVISNNINNIIDEVIISDIDLDRRNELLVCHSESTSIFKITKPEILVASTDNNKYKSSLGEAILWPGNTNSDTKVDELDIINIVSAWGRNGWKREDNTTSEWKETKVNLWGDISATFADTNGDGIINEDDILVIAKNWGKEIKETTTINNNKNKAPSPVPSLLDPQIEHTKHIDKFRLMYKKLKEEGRSYEGTREVKLALIKLMNHAFLLTQPSETKVLKTHPNPFRDECWIPFRLSQPADELIVKIYNVSGQLIKVINLYGNFVPAEYKACRYSTTGSLITTNKDIDISPHAIYWDSRDENFNKVPSGIYFVQLTVKKNKKMLSTSAERLVKLR